MSGSLHMFVFSLIFLIIQIGYFVNCQYVQAGSKLVGQGNIGPGKTGWATSISSDGSIVVAGASEDNPVQSSFIGCVYVFTRSGSVGSYVWAQQAKLVGSGYVCNNQYNCVQLGWTVGISGDGSTIGIGGLRDQITTGAVFVFTKSGASWAQQGSKLVSSGLSTLSSQFQSGSGVLLSSNGNTLLSCHEPVAFETGAATVFVRGTSWSQQRVFQETSSPYQGQKFASWCDMSSDGNTVALGEAGDNSNVGAVIIYFRSGTTWTFQGKLIGSGYIGQPNIGDRNFGLDPSGNNLYMGGHNDNSGVGAIWYFTRVGSSWSQVGSKSTLATGYSVSVASSNLLYIAGRGDGTYVYTRTSTTSSYTQYGSAILGDNAGGNGQYFSKKLSNDGSTIVVGANNDNGNAGAIFIFTRSTQACMRPVDTASSTYSTTCAAWINSGSTCTPVCNSGYSFSGGGSTAMTCSNTVLANATSVCIPSPCPIPSDTSSTIYSSVCSSPLTSGTSCTPVCRNGYNASGATTISCSFGVLSSPAGSCLPNPCPRPADTNSTIYAQANCPISTNSGSQCIPSCRPGYSPNASLAMTCTTGNFSKPLGSCLPNPCARPNNTNTTTYAACTSPIASGTTCNYNCQPGHYATGSLALDCFAGVLSSPTAACLESPCDIPVVTSPYTIGSCTSVIESGKNCFLGCGPGFVSNGNMQVFCSRGNFSALPSTSQCVPALPSSLCTQPTPPYPKTPGNCSYSYANGTSCLTSCANGRTPVGNFVATCINGTTLLDLNSVCSEDPCTVPLLPVGMMSGSCGSIVAGNHTCDFVCSSGFEQIGSLNVECASSVLSSPLGNCRANDCYQVTIQLGVGENVGDCDAVMASGSSCNLSCDELYSPIGSALLHCFAGSFNRPNPGYCVRIQTISTSAYSIQYNGSSQYLPVSEGTILTAVLSPGTYPSDLYLSSLNVNGIIVLPVTILAASSIYSIPFVSNLPYFYDYQMLLSVTSISSNFTDVFLSNFSLTLRYLSVPTLQNVCPDQIRTQVPQTVAVRGAGFIPTESIRCVINNTFAFAPLSVDSEAVTCRVVFPIDISGMLVNFNVVNDGALEAKRQVPIQILLIGACESVKPGSVPGLVDCECPAGTRDAGSACIKCENGFYQPNSNQGQCLTCGNNEDTNMKTGSVSMSSCVCRESTFPNPESKSLDCLPCKKGMECPGNSVIIILPGYWRASNKTAAVLSCPLYDSCIGTQMNTTNLCNVGYSGPLCAVCSDGYALLGNKCTVCPPGGGSTVVLVILILLTIGLAAFMIRSAEIWRHSSSSSDDSNDKLKMQAKGSLGVCVKVTINFMQVLYYLGKLSANWSVIVSKFFAVIGLVGALSPSSFSFECSATWTFYGRLIFVYLFPLFVIVTLLLVYAIRHKIYNMSIRDSKNDCQLATMLILYQIHPTIMLEIVQSFPCLQIPGTGTSFLKADLTVDCSTKQYKVYVAISSVYLLFYTFGMIVFVVWRLRHNFLKLNLSNPKSSSYQKYAFFFIGFRQPVYFWEAVIMCRKMSIVFFSVIASASYQLLLGLVVLTFSLLLHIQFTPFVSPFVNLLETISLLSLYFTVVLGTVFHLSSPTDNTLWTTIILIVMNTATFILLISTCMVRMQGLIHSIVMYIPDTLIEKIKPDYDHGIQMTRMSRKSKTLSITVSKETSSPDTSIG